MDRRPAQLRTVEETDSGAAEETAQPLQPAFEVNPLAELVADIIEATALLPPDRLAFVRDKARTSSFAQALVDEGLAEGGTIAKSLAARHNLPLIDVIETGVSPEAAETVPLHVLERLTAIPYALEGDTLKVAIADPANVHAIDELRLATRFQLELGVA